MRAFVEPGRMRTARPRLGTPGSVCAYAAPVKTAIGTSAAMMYRWNILLPLSNLLGRQDSRARQHTERDPLRPGSRGAPLQAHPKKSAAERGALNITCDLCRFTTSLRTGYQRWSRWSRYPGRRIP